MVHIDKLKLAFNIRLQYCNCEIWQFDKLAKKLENIDKLNDHSDKDFVEDMNTEIEPYLFNKTELKEATLTEIKTHFKNNYWVYVNNIKVGLLQWESHGTNKNYGYFTLLNNTLYNGDWKLYKQMLNDLQLTISHVCNLDIAHDSTVDITKKYLRIISDKKNEIIINGNRINNRDMLLQSPYFITFGSLNEPMKQPQLYLRTKDKSTTVRCYNKSEEIEEKSHKEYIKEKYKNTENDIYRCEITLNTHSLNRIINDIITANNFDTEEEGLTLFMKSIEYKEYLLKLHRDAMFRLIRYSHKGEKRKTIISYYNYI